MYNNFNSNFMYSYSSITGKISSLDSFSFGLLHAMVSIVMLTLIHKEIKLENSKEINNDKK